jgi:hypothetical protein
MFHPSSASIHTFFSHIVSISSDVDLLAIFFLDEFNLYLIVTPLPCYPALP